MNNKQSLYLLWATILNQSQSAETVLENTFELFRRLNLFSNFDKEYKNLDYEKIEKNVATKPCLHRFPKNMSINIWYSVCTINEKYNKTYSIKTTLMKNNTYEIEELINLAIKYNCNTIKFNCVREDGRAVQNKNSIVLSQEEYIETIKKIEELSKKYETKIKIRAPLNIFGCDDNYEFIPELGFGCFAGKESICIDPIGNVKPCSNYPKEFICGNVKKDNLKYIWNNSVILKQFRELKGNDICNNCKEYNNCRGGCRYRCFKEGDINRIDPFCYLKNNL